MSLHVSPQIVEAAATVGGNRIVTAVSSSSSDGACPVGFKPTEAGQRITGHPSAIAAASSPFRSHRDPGAVRALEVWGGGPEGATQGFAWPCLHWRSASCSTMPPIQLHNVEVAHVPAPLPASGATPAKGFRQHSSSSWRCCLGISALRQHLLEAAVFATQLVVAVWATPPSTG